MKDLPIELKCKISGYYPSPELTPTKYCNIKQAHKDHKYKSIKEYIKNIIDDVINNTLYINV
tara:strand:- start:606 stop:791 length:186 start_codon:yes stop_codon:yes gene_type:complete